MGGSGWGWLWEVGRGWRRVGLVRGVWGRVWEDGVGRGVGEVGEGGAVSGVGWGGWDRVGEVWGGWGWFRVCGGVWRG